MLLIQFLNALQFSMTLFLLAVGLTIIFGLMKIVNLAHGSLYMIGAYVGLSIWSYFDSFWLALIFSPIITSTWRVCFVGKRVCTTCIFLWKYLKIN